MFPYCIDAQLGAVLELILLIVPVFIWFTTLLTGSRC